MKHLVWIAAAFASAAVLATPAMANAPNGNGHVITIGIPCDGAEPQLIRLTRNLGKSAWVELHRPALRGRSLRGDDHVHPGWWLADRRRVVLQHVRKQGGPRAADCLRRVVLRAPFPAETLAGTIRGETYYLPPGN